jgi:hypothetical protein
MSDRLRVCYLWRAVSCPLSLRRRNRESAKRKSAGSCVRNRAAAPSRVSGLFRFENSVGAGSGQTAGTGRARNRGSRLIPIGVLKLIFAEADEFVLMFIHRGRRKSRRNPGPAKFNCLKSWRRTAEIGRFGWEGTAQSERNYSLFPSRSGAVT